MSARSVKTSKAGTGYIDKYLQTMIANGQLQIVNSTSDALYFVQGSQILDSVNVILPLLSGDDTFAFQNFNNEFGGVQTFNKGLVTQGGLLILPDPNNILDPNLTLFDGIDIITGTNEGTAIGTDPTQRVGFYGANPISQPGVTLPATGNTMVQDMWNALVNCGLISSAAGAGASPLLFTPTGGTDVDTPPAYPGDFFLSTSSGYWMGTGTASIQHGGLLTSPNLTGNSPILVAPTFTVTSGVTNGTYTTLESTGSGTVDGGINMLKGVTSRSKNCRARFRFAFSSGTSSNSRMWMGFTDQTVVMTNQSNPLNSQSGVIFGFQRNGTDSGATGNWTIGSNNGGSSMTFNDTGKTVDSVFHTVTIQANDSTPNFVVTFDNNTPVTLTSTIPATSTSLNFFIEMQNPGTTTTTASFAWADLIG